MPLKIKGALQMRPSGAVMTPFQGVWFAIALLLPVAFFLVYKAANDSALFNMDSYTKPFRVLMKRFGGSAKA